MQLKRFFSNDAYKNKYGYIDSQKKYEVIRTVVYFGISLSLLIAGYITTKSRLNVLTVVAILGCLPASKSLVSMIMFLRQHSFSQMVYDSVNDICSDMEQLYDLVFTTEKVTYPIAHAACTDKGLVLFSEKKSDIAGLEKHIEEYMKRANIYGIKAKVYTDLKKYTERLEQMDSFEKENPKQVQAVIQLLKEITL